MFASEWPISDTQDALVVRYHARGDKQPLIVAVSAVVPIDEQTLFIAQLQGEGLNVYSHENGKVVIEGKRRSTTAFR